MNEQSLLDDVDKSLAEYGDADWRHFVRSDGRGAVHSLGDERELSPTNTAFLSLLAKDLPKYATGLKPRDCERWARTIVLPTLKTHLKQVTKHSAKPQAVEYDAYRLARLLVSAWDDTAARALVVWTTSYTRRWLLGTGGFNINLFIVYLAWKAVGRLPGFPTRNVQRVAHFALAHHVAFGMANLSSDLDAIDLALALAMSDVTSIPSRLFASGLEVLNRQASQGRTWRNQQLFLRVGERIIGCSAFDACLALLEGSSGARVASALRDALVSHVAWLRERRLARPPWRISDLYPRDALTEPWFNVLVVQFLLTLRLRLEDSQRATLLTKYRGTSLMRSQYRWPTDMVLEPRWLKAIERAFIQPARSNKGKELSQCTAIMFGPPGTTKSTIAETIASELGWAFLEIGVADFLAKSLEEVFSTATEIFRDLLNLDRVVVLLDEVEGVFAEREGVERDLRQKFLTSALLPPLRQVKKRGRILLLIATNHISEFDAAVRRPGRIDLIIPVGPPNAKHRRRLLKATGLSSDTAARLNSLLPKYATVEEILAVRRLPKPTSKRPKAAAQALFREWKERYSSGQISAIAMDKFRQESKRYARLD